jgi:hypothetical protein
MLSPCSGVWGVGQQQAKAWRGRNSPSHRRSGMLALDIAQAVAEFGPAIAAIVLLLRK